MPEREAFERWCADNGHGTLDDMMMPMDRALKSLLWTAWQAGTAWQRADMQILTCQVGSLRAALLNVLNTREQEAKAWFAYETARDNYTGGAALESQRHLAMMQAASSAEKEARLLLATLKTPNARLSGATR